MARSAWAITYSVWRALFLREAIHRLFYRRGAWIWLLLEPVVHMAFFTFIFVVVRVRVIGGIDTTIWLMSGFLGFFMFRRTMNVGINAITMAKALFTYRQVKPVDSVLVRPAAEGVLMMIIFIIVMLAISSLGVNVLPDNGFGVLYGLFTLWLLGLGVGLIISIPKVIVAEVGDIFGLIMSPLYIMSGVIFPIAAVPDPYRGWLVLNPIVHSLEFMRISFSDHYEAIDELDIFYPLFYALTLVFFGLILQRIYKRKVIQL